METGKSEMEFSNERTWAFPMEVSVVNHDFILNFDMKF